MIRSALRPRRVVASTVTLRLTIPSFMSWPRDQFSPASSTHRSLTGYRQRQADPVLPEFDSARPARLDPCVGGRATVDGLRFLRLPAGPIAWVLPLLLPRLLDDAHRLLPQGCQTVEGRAPGDRASALMLPRIDRVRELDLDRAAFRAQSALARPKGILLPMSRASSSLTIRWRCGDRDPNWDISPHHDARRLGWCMSLGCGCPVDRPGAA